MVLAHFHLIAEIGRPIGDQQEFGTGFLQRLGHVFMPAIFADGRANAGIANAVGTTQGARIKNAHLIKDGLVRQVVLQHFGGDLAAFQDQVGVIKLVTFRPRRANGQRRAICDLNRQGFDCSHGGAVKGGFHHQILCIVAGDEHFRQRNKIGPCIAALFPRRARFGGIAVQIAHCRVQLCQCHAKTVAREAHRKDPLLAQFVQYMSTALTCNRREEPAQRPRSGSQRAATHCARAGKHR